MKEFAANLPFNFATQKLLDVNFSKLDLSSDAGLLLVKQAEENFKVCEGIANCLEDNREQHKVKHPLFQLVSQRIYQIAAGYEDTNDSNSLRHDPIFKLICDKVAKIGSELLASQPTISRLENQISQKEIKAIRRFFVDKFIQNHPEEPQQIVLDIDGFDAFTHGHQQLSLFHGYYGHQIYFPVLIDDVYYAAKTWEKPRRIVMKAEWLSQGANPRFLVTNLETEPQEVYDNFYVQRGATSEHRIKEIKLGLNADRLSCRRFIVNQFRLFLFQAAYILMLEIRASAQGTRLATAQVSRLRETIIKIAAKVSVSVRRTLVELAAHCPFADDILVIVQRLASGQQLIFS